MTDTTFNTSINILGSISDYELVFTVLRDNLLSKSKLEIKENIITNSPILIRTQSSKTRIIDGILEGFGNTFNSNHNQILAALFDSSDFKKLKIFSLYLQLAANNNLFYLITKSVFIPRMRSGRLTLSSEDVEAYLWDLRNSNQTIKKWTDSTLHTIAYKYFTIMKKFGFIEGREIKEIIPFTPNQEMIIYFLYFVKAVEPEINDIFMSRFIDFLLISKESLLFSLKSIWAKDFIDIATTGSNLQIELNYNFSEIINELSKRYQTDF